MEMNLIKFVQDERLIQRMQTMLAKHRYTNLTSFLYRNFPSPLIQGLNQELLSEIVDLFAGLAEETEPKTALPTLRQSVVQLKQHYVHQTHLIDQQYRAIKPGDRQLPPLMTVAQIKPLNLAKRQQILNRLDLYDQYHSYHDGFKAEQNDVYTWLIEVIDESLAERSHKTKTNQDFIG